MNTAYHASYFAHELTKRCPSDSVGKLAASLSDAQVDLNPHQVEAALFAFQSPLSKGAILADEVGLGKTIEAGILLSQRWAERKRRLLIIVPSNLRKQWSQELADKFFLPSLILEARSFNAHIKARNLDPFHQPDAIVICSYQFARSKEPYVAQTEWDLVVIDEAHRLRNVYKPGNSISIEREDYALALPFGKKLAMMSKSPRGERVRDYFIECERRALAAPAGPDFSDSLAVARLLQDTTARFIEAETARRDAERQIAEQAPAVAFARKVELSPLDMPVGAFAKSIGWGPIRLHRELRRRGFMYKLGGHCVPKQAHVTAGLFTVKQVPVGTRVFPVAAITGKGQLRLARELGLTGQLMLVE